MKVKIRCDEDGEEQGRESNWPSIPQAIQPLNDGMKTFNVHFP